ncbi:hypothetical protein HDU96_000266 [Phlyctochytrium bullatum]|nr:hypothetical protein HDU96_000266 [Phlyctochytrium bullatum]
MLAVEDALPPTWESEYRRQFTWKASGPGVGRRNKREPARERTGIFNFGAEDADDPTGGNVMGAWTPITEEFVKKDVTHSKTPPTASYDSRDDTEDQEDQESNLVSVFHRPSLK